MVGCLVVRRVLCGKGQVMDGTGSDQGEWYWVEGYVKCMEKIKGQGVWRIKSQRIRH